MHSRDPECTFHPAINASSRTMKARSVTELSRGDALKRETAARLLKLQLEQADLGGITFQPRINERSRCVGGRGGVGEMRRGAERFASQPGGHQLTYSPPLPPSPSPRSNVESRLKILAEPDTYVARLNQEATVMAERARRAASEAEAAELRECTFHPAVHSAPEYVSRIAKSMALARSVKPQHETARPDWR
jgi:hypothetical protein